MLGNFNISETSTLYDFCKRLVLLYEMESDLYELGVSSTDEIRDSICMEILDVQDELKRRIKNDEL